ncbi:MAG: DUF547 domain-containing protein [Planctomycetota bacterium]|nr:DUF547 domain-containing protein [Planctomycetota bacterium]
MIKNVAVFVITIAILLFITGCPSKKLKPVKQAYKGQAAAQANAYKAKPKKVKQGNTEPNAAQPKDIKPQLAEPNMPPAKPSEPNTPNKVPSGTIEPNAALDDNSEPNISTNLSKLFCHDKCASILGTYVGSTGMVDYKNLKRKKPELIQTLNEFQTLDPNTYNSWHREDKIAFWINAYNMQMLKIIVDNYPIESSRLNRLWWPLNSVRHIPPSDVIGTAKWDSCKFIVMNEEFTLSEIEQRFFIKEFDEPRAFLAVSYASISGPPLRNVPYSGLNLNQQLDDQVKRFLISPYALGIDKQSQVVYLSAIFDATWHGDSFISKYGTDKKFKEQPTALRAVLNFITGSIPKQDVDFLEVGNYSVKYINYDWRLNE